MLYAIEEDGHLKEITEVPHREKFARWMRTLQANHPGAYEEIRERLLDHFDGRQVETSSFIPGQAWSNTVFQPIYEVCGEEWEQAGFFFGLIVWATLMEHEAAWSFGKYLTDENIFGMTYFRIDNPEHG